MNSQENRVLSGLYINLDRSVKRRELLLAHLEAHDFGGMYERFSALEPNVREALNLKGLKTPGEYGIWKSIISALKYISVSNNCAPVVHLIEDDARFSPRASKILTYLANAMTRDVNLLRYDIIFADYFLTKNLFKVVVKQQGQIELKLLAADAYLACLASFLIRKASAAFIAECLERIFVNSSKLLPVDLALRSIIRQGIVPCLCVSPPLGSCDWDMSQTSTIQDQSAMDLHKSRLAHILLRLCASGLATPIWCAERLVQLFGVTDADPMEFLRVFEKVEHKLVQF